MQKIRIDFDNPGLPQHISAVENDSQSRFFQTTLYENGKAYTAPEGATYSIMYRGFGPQNQGWYDTINDGAGKRAACAVSGNVVTCEIARQALQVPGHVSIVLCVTTGKGYMLKSWPIECDCKNDRYDSTAEIQSFFYITQVSNADWTQAIQAWESLKDTIDPTLSVSGKAADAAKVGEAVNAEAERAKGVESQIKEELSSLGDNTGIEKPNLLSASFPYRESNGITWTPNNDRSIKISGTSTKTEYNYITFSLNKGSYILSGIQGGSIETFFMRLVKEDGSYFDLSDGELKFSVESETENLKLYVRIGKNITVDNTLYPMIRDAKYERLPYIPYGIYYIDSTLADQIKKINDRLNVLDGKDCFSFWKNKKASFVGDSITQGNSSRGTYVTTVSEILGLSSYQNLGIGGCCMASSDQDSQYTPVVLRLDSIDADTDIIYIQAGTNDYSHQIPLGEKESKDITTFNGALNAVMSYLRENHPSKLVVFGNILNRLREDNASENERRPIHIDNYRSAIKDRCEANHYIFFDNKSNVDFDFGADYYAHTYSDDGLHPNKAGAEVLGRVIAKFIENH